MQSLPPAGSPYSEGPIWSGRGLSPTPPPSPQDRMESSRPAQDKLIKPSPFPNTSPSAETPPRPRMGELPRWSALSAVGARGQAELTGAMLPGPLALALQPTLEGEARSGPQPRGEWDATATPEGWRVPRNPNRTPISPRFPFEIRQGHEDLGPLRLVASSHGRIRALRLQWPEEFQEPAFSAQKAVFLDILTRLPEDIRVEVVAEGLAGKALPAMLAEWGIPAPERVHIHALHLHSSPEILYEPMTMWSRDGALLLRTQDGLRHVLLLPRSFRGDGQVDPKLNRLTWQGTGAAPARLQEALPQLVVRRSEMGFEGGDVVASGREVLLGGHTLARNMSELRLSRQAVLERFTQLFGLPVTVIEPQPDFHLDLGLTFLDDHTVAVADPEQAIGLVAGRGEFKPLLKVTREQRLAEKYQQAATLLGERGYKVIRLPNLAGVGLQTPYYTYNNVLIERYLSSGRQVKKVYMPVYDVAELDEAARQTYRDQGFQVVDMPSARFSTKLWGAIRCATGDLEISEQGR